MKFIEMQLNENANTECRFSIGFSDKSKLFLKPGLVVINSRMAKHFNLSTKFQIFKNKIPYEYFIQLHFWFYMKCWKLKPNNPRFFLLEAQELNRLSTSWQLVRLDPAR